MARTAKEIISAIESIRYANKRLYIDMEKIIHDRTLWVVQGAYASNRAEAQKLHKLIISNDKKITSLSEELCESVA